MKIIISKCICFSLVLISLVLFSLPLAVSAQEASEDNASSRQAVPDDAAIAEARAIVRELYQEEFKEAKSVAKKIVLAKSILKSGVDAEGATVDDWVDYFVLGLSHEAPDVGDDVQNHVSRQLGLFVINRRQAKKSGRRDFCRRQVGH